MCVISHYSLFKLCSFCSSALRPDFRITGDCSPSLCYLMRRKIFAFCGMSRVFLKIFSKNRHKKAPVKARSPHGDFLRMPAARRERRAGSCHYSFHVPPHQNSKDVKVLAFSLFWRKCLKNQCDSVVLNVIYITLKCI